MFVSRQSREGSFSAKSQGWTLLMFVAPTAAQATSKDGEDGRLQAAAYAWRARDEGDVAGMGHGQLGDTGGHWDLHLCTFVPSHPASITRDVVLPSPMAAAHWAQRGVEGADGRHWVWHHCTPVPLASRIHQ
eukprot:228143-Chlamydomonas_euryale.AAC.5